MTAGSPKKDSPMTKIAQSPEDMRSKLKLYITDIMAPLLKCNGNISIGVSGGSMAKLLCDVLKTIKVDWRRIKLFMVDERFVPLTHDDSNYKAYISNLPPNMHHCVVKVPMDESLARTATLYETLLKQECMPEQMGRIPRFDMLFLGMGPDGHTCSLFPQHKLLKVDPHPSWVLTLDDSPKPPPKRVTISLHCINAAKNVAFIVTGEDKSTVLKAVLDRDPAYPASLVRPHNNQLSFFLDSAAASKL